MKKVLWLALLVSGCDCSSMMANDAGNGGGGGGSSAGGGTSTGGGGGGTGGGAADSGSGCQWTLTGQLTLSGTCGAAPAVGYDTAFDTLAFELDTDANVTFGIFKFVTSKMGMQTPGPIDSATATTYAGTVTRYSDSAKWELSKPNADGSFQLAFTDGGTSEPVAGGNLKFVGTHGSLDATLVPAAGGTNPATGDEAFHATW